MVDVTLNTRHGIVYVLFDDKENVSEVLPEKPTSWDEATWRRERPKLIRRARKLCAKVGTTVRTTATHGSKLNGKIVVVHNDNKKITAVGIYLLSAHPDYFILATDSRAGAVNSGSYEKKNWKIISVYDPK